MSTSLVQSDGLSPGVVTNWLICGSEAIPFFGQAPRSCASVARNDKIEKRKIENVENGKKLKTENFEVRGLRRDRDGAAQP